MMIIIIVQAPCKDLQRLLSIDICLTDTTWLAGSKSALDISGKVNSLLVILTIQTHSLQSQFQDDKMVSRGKEKLALIIATLLLEITAAILSDGTSVTSSSRERRGMVFPNGTTLQVRSDTSLSWWYALDREYRPKHYCNNILYSCLMLVLYNVLYTLDPVTAQDA